MSEPDDDPFLERWLRRKNEAASGRTPVEDAAEAPADPEPVTPEPVATAPGEPVPPAETEASEPADREITDADLPDLDELGEDSDYSMFMSKGVSREKRQAALRKLFHSPKFNVTDGLDDYCEDFTKFEPLGGIMTADMRHHAERLARKALEAVSGDEEAVAAEASGEGAPAGGDPGSADAAAAAPGDSEPRASDEAEAQGTTKRDV